MSINVGGVIIKDKLMLKAYNAFMGMSLENKINILSICYGFTPEKISQTSTIGDINDSFKQLVVVPFIEKYSK